MNQTLSLFEPTPTTEGESTELAPKECAPRQYAMDIFKTYPEEERLMYVDDLVPARLRAWVRHYLISWQALDDAGVSRRDISGEP